MKFTPRYVKAMKYLLLFAVIMFVYSAMLSYLGMEYLSINNPEEDTTLKVVLNKLKRILFISAFWMTIGYLTRDFKAAIVALSFALGVTFGFEKLFPDVYYGYGTTKGLSYYLVVFSGFIQYLAFGITHFRSKIGLKLIVTWAILFGFGIAYNSFAFRNMIMGLGRMLGIRDFLEIGMPSGSNTQSINIFTSIFQQLRLIFQISIFWWIYRVIETKKPFWESLHTCHISTAPSRIVFSIIYWTLRLYLFVAGLSVMSFIARTFSSQFEMITLIRVIFCIFSLFVVASIYRNFLVSHLAKREEYPRGLFVLLNIPIINFFGWLYIMGSFYNLNANVALPHTKDKISGLKQRFIKSGKNSGWKITIIVLTIIISLYKLNKAGLRFDAPSKDGVLILSISLFISLCMLIWFLYDKSAYIPILILASLGLVIATITRSGSFIESAMAANIINIALFFGMFQFDELEWDGA